MKRDAVLYPFLVAVFPIVFLYAQNADELRFRDVIGPLIVVLVAAFLVMAVLSRLCRSRDMAGILTATLFLLFFTYGTWFHLLELRTEQLQTSRNHLALVLGSSLVFLVVTRVAQGLGDRIVSFTPLLNFVAAGLVLIQLGTAGFAVWERQSLRGEGVDLQGVGSPEAPAPDIFFILLDGYGRQDVLADLYDFDNRDFLGALEERGFQVAEDSRAPYSQTLLSLAAVFNLDYLTGFAPDLDPEAKDRVGLSSSIWDSVAIRSLESRGYSTAAFATGYTMTEFKGADRYLVPGDHLSEFSRLLITRTPLQILVDAGVRAERHRGRIEYIFEMLPELQGTDRPLFVLAHVIAPHPPFVFGEDSDGRPGNRWFGLADGSHRAVSRQERDRYRDRYKDQLKAVNELVLESLDQILGRSAETRPVIVLASDHGPGSELRWHSSEETDLRERLASLFAIYYPDGGARTELPEPLTPINTFRMIFNRLFGGDYALLPARSFFSTWEEPYQFEEIEDSRLGVTVPGPAD